MSIEPQEMRVTVQVNIKGYKTVQALKDICIIARSKENWKLYPPKRRIEANKLIEDIFKLA